MYVCNIVLSYYYQSSIVQIGLISKYYQLNTSHNLIALISTHKIINKNRKDTYHIITMSENENTPLTMREVEEPRFCCCTAKTCSMVWAIIMAIGR